MHIPATTLHFLAELSRNNTREWFQAHRPRYEAAKAQFGSVIADLIVRIGDFEDLGPLTVRECSYRMARDIRFTHNKDPYKHWLAASFAKGGRRASVPDYYLHVEPGGRSFVGGGMWAPSPAELAAFRQEIDYSPRHLRAIIDAPAFVGTFGPPVGEQLKTAPRGYAKDHPDIALLRLSQCFFQHFFSDEAVMAADFTERVASVCRELKPYLDYLKLIFREAESAAD